MRSFHQGEGRLFYDNPLNDIIECDYCFEKIKPDEDWEEAFCDGESRVFFYHKYCAEFK